MKRGVSLHGSLNEVKGAVSDNTVYSVESVEGMRE